MSRTGPPENERDDESSMWPWLVGGLVVIAVAAAAFWVLTRSEKPAENQPPRPPLVEVAPVEAIATAVIRQTGFLRPVAEVEIVSEVTARIISVSDAFTLGATLSEGEVLVELDTARLRAEERRAEAAVGQAEAVIAEARISVDRQQTLEERNVASEATLQQALVELATAEAALETAEAERNLIRQRIDDTIIRAPFDAIVAEENADIGQLATSGAPLGRLIAISQAEVELGLVPDDIELLGGAVRAIGAQVAIRSGNRSASDAATPQIARGTVTAIGPQIAGQTRTLTLIVRIDRPFDDTRDGLPAARALRIDELLTLELPVDLGDRRAVAVPSRALKAGDTVWTVRDGALRRNDVTVLQRGAGSGDRVILGSGAPEAGALVMLTDLVTAADGTRVRTDTDRAGAGSGDAHPSGTDG